MCLQAAADLLLTGLPCATAFRTYMPSLHVGDVSFHHGDSHDQDEDDGNANREGMLSFTVLPAAKFRVLTLFRNLFEI